MLRRELDVVEAVLGPVGVAGEHGEEGPERLDLSHGFGVRQAGLDALLVTVRGFGLIQEEGSLVPIPFICFFPQVLPVVSKLLPTHACVLKTNDKG